MFVSKYDKSKITEILSKQDIYHITSLPWEVAARDCGVGRGGNKLTLRNNWMYDNDGFYKSIHLYSNTFKRIDEYLERGDAPYTLRQRINIVNELLDCDFNTNLPLHISFEPNDELYKNTTINLNDDSINNYEFIIHPGQTRAQGSVFTRTNLKNVLIYVKKEHNVDVKMKVSNYLRKIESLEELFEVYNPNSEVDKDRLSMSFSTPNIKGKDYDEGFKKHHQFDITILKCFGIHEYPQPVNRVRKKYHSSIHYTYRSLKSITNFYKLLSNNIFNIYSNNNEWLGSKNNSNQANLYHKKNENNEWVEYPKNAVDTFESYLDLVFNTNAGNHNEFKDTILGIDDMFSNNERELFKKYYLFLSKNKELLQEMFSNSKNLIFKPQTKKIHLTSSDLSFFINFWKKIVTKNKFSGICMYMHDSIIKVNDRDIHEFLFCINSEVSMTRSDDNKVAIINCEHEYWKTGKNYKEWILPETFYTP